MSAGESKTEIAEITCVQTLRGHADWVRSVCASADGSRLFSGSDDNDDQGVGRGDGRVPADAGGARGWGEVGVRVGRRIPAVLGECDETIKVWDVATGACLQTLEGHADAVRSVCASADGSRLFSGSATDDQGVGRGDGRVPADAGGARGWGAVGVRVGRRIPAVLGECDKTIKVWDVATGACLQTLEGHADGCGRCARRPTDPGCSRGVATRRSRCGTWRRARACRRWRGTRMGVVGVRVGRRIPAVLGEWRQDDQGVGRGDGRVPADAGGARELGESVCASADGSRLFSGSGDTTIKVWSSLPARWKTLVAEVEAEIGSNLENNLPSDPRHDYAWLIMKSSITFRPFKL